MSLIATSFTAVGVGAAIQVNHKQSLSYSVSGTFVGTVKVEKSEDGGVTFAPLTSSTAAATGTLVHESSVQGPAHFRFRCTAFTSGTIVTSIFSNAVLPKTLQVNATAYAKAGTTSGFVVAVADNLSLVTCPASKTASTLVLPLPQLTVGQIITGFHLVGQIESVGGIVTVDAALRKMVAAAADPTDSLIASMTQLSVTAETVMSDSNTSKLGLSEIVTEDAIYYLLITATTAASTDIALQGASIQVVG
jgi:hypothetical protein